MSENQIRDIIKTMIDWNLLNPCRLFDTDYVAERIKLYIETRNFVHTNFKNCF